MTGSAALDRHFWDVLGADVSGVRPGEIVVAKSPRREVPEGDLAGITVPVYILVSAGRGVVSSSRFLFRIAESWAEDFAAPDYLLVPGYLEDLHADIARSLDVPVTISRSRLFTPAGDLPDGCAVRVLEIQPGRTTRQSILDCIAPTERILVLSCHEADRGAARAIIEAGYVEYGRTVRFEANR